MEKRLVVIIDDEEDLLDLYEYNFRKRGFSVATFDRAKPALEFLKKEKPAIILCDWMMPEIDGLEMCKRVKSDMSLAEIPFLMVTCRTDKSSVKQALAVGVTDFLTKPIGMNELVGRVEFILGHGRSTMTG